MAEISRNDQLDNVIEALAPRIEIQWEPRTDSGNVLFFMKEYDRRLSDWYVNREQYVGTLNVSISDIAADSYTYIDPATGEEKTVAGGEVIEIVKAVTDRRWQISQMPPAEETSPIDAGLAVEDGIVGIA